MQRPKTDCGPVPARHQANTRQSNMQANIYPNASAGGVASASAAAATRVEATADTTVLQLFLP